MKHLGTVHYRGKDYHLSVRVLPYGNQYAINGRVYDMQFLYWSDRYVFAKLSGIDYYDEALDTLCECDSDCDCICGNRLLD